MQGTATRILWQLVKFAVTVGALWIALRSVGVDRVLAAVARAAPLWLVAAGAVTAIQIPLLVWRWGRIHELLTGTRLRGRFLLFAIGRGLLLGQFMPATVGGDVVRIASVASEGGLALVVRSVICDRLLGLICIVANVVVALPVLALVVDGAAVLAGIGLVAASGLSAFAMFLLLPKSVARIPFLGGFVGQAAADLRLVLRSRGHGFLPILLSVLLQLLAMTTFVALARSLGGDLSLGTALLIVPPVQLLASVPVSLGGWGVREAGIASAFALVGADPAMGTTASILLGLSSPAAGAVIELIGIVVPSRRAARKSPARDAA